MVSERVGTGRMRKLKSILKRLFVKPITLWYKQLKTLLWYQKMIYIVFVVLVLILFVILFTNFKPSYVFYGVVALTLLIKLIIFIINLIANGRISGNGIVYGNKGSGKGHILQFKAIKLNTYFSNVPMGYNQKEFVPREYFNVLNPNTIVSTINDIISLVDKAPYLKYEGVSILWDDLAVYAPNFMDTVLLKYYPTAPLMLAINRHLFNHYMIVSVQDRQRPWKIIRELSADFSCKALKTVGWGKIFSSVPIVRNYVFVFYRWYQEIKPAEEGILPFKAKGIVNKGARHLYLTSGQATKEDFEAKYGKIAHGVIVIKKSKIKYDTRYFHEKFFGVKALP